MTRPLVIVGGGLAGGLAALAFAERRPEVPILLIEESHRLGGSHVWSYFDGDVAEEDRPLVAPLVEVHWGRHDVIFPKRRRTLPFGYNSIRSERFDAVLRERLKPEQLRLSTGAALIEAERVILDSGEEIAALGVIDARGPGASLPPEHFGWQKFVGREYRFDAPHGLERPIVMDATVDQADGYRFVYCLPFSDRTMLVEDTYYSLSPDLDRAAIGGRIDAYMAAQGWPAATMLYEETGVLPVALGGDIAAFWAGRPVARIGLRGGFFHPTTGYSLPDAVRLASLIARQSDLSGPALYRLTRAAAEETWRARRFYRLLDRMLFHAAAPAERYRVLEHFYRLDPAIIARFYAARTTLGDKVRILSGRPPVPLLKAIKALWQ
ncbi:MAG TPA: lycopene beta-cyclase CrtY [Allosphingosinicella sp.]